MAKGLLLKTLLFIAESQETKTTGFPQSVDSKSKNESPRSDWSSESSECAPVHNWSLNEQGSLLVSPAGESLSNLSSVSSSLSSASEDSAVSDQAESDFYDLEVIRRHRRRRSTTESPEGNWGGDASFAPWLENNSTFSGVAVLYSYEEELVMKPLRKSPPPTTDACPICVKPMSCMETLFAPSCGYLCHLSCVQRTLKNNLENERGERPLEVNSMRCPICFAQHPLANGVQFSDVRGGESFCRVNQGPPGGSPSPPRSPKFLPGESRRVLQPTKAAHTRGYASEADGLVNPRRFTPQVDAPQYHAPPSSQELQPPLPRRTGYSSAPEQSSVVKTRFALQHASPPSSLGQTTSAPPKCKAAFPPRPKLRTLRSAPAQLYSRPGCQDMAYNSDGGQSRSRTHFEGQRGYVSEFQNGPTRGRAQGPGSECRIPGQAPEGSSPRPRAVTPAEQVSARLADFYRITSPPPAPKSGLRSAVSLPRLQRTQSM